METTKKRITSALAALMVVMLVLVGVTPAYADDGSTVQTPNVGGRDYGSADGGALIVHKLDIAQFEKNKAAALIASSGLSAGGTVTYTGNSATGSALTSTSVVGSYTTSDAPGTKVPVTLGELNTITNVIFQLEPVKLSSGKTPGSTNPDDYEAVTSTVGGYGQTDTNGLISWTGLPNGYYRITEIMGGTAQAVGASRYIVSLPMVDPADSSKTINTVHLYPKNRLNDGPVVEKDKPQLADFNGNVVSWTIKSEIPATLAAAKGSQSYVISDTMSNGITFAGNMKVFYRTGGNPVELSKGTDYTTNATNGGTSFTVTLETAGFAKLGGALPNGIDKDANGRYLLYITYDSVVSLTEEHFTNSIKPNNTVELNFTNSDGTAYKSTPDPATVDNYAGIRLIKQDGSDKSVFLPGAKFKVYTALASGGTAVEATSVLKSSTGAELVFETGADGKFLAGGLGAGTYYLVETDAPTGYSKLSGFSTITVSTSDVEGNRVIETTVLNYRDNGLSLPTTGGIGTMLFIGGGLALIVVAAVILLVSRRRMKASNINE